MLHRACVYFLSSFQQPVSFALGRTLLLAEPQPDEAAICVSFLGSFLITFSL
jgi:hypothetical protein